MNTDFPQDGMTAADIACVNSQKEVHQELLSCGAHQGALIEPQVAIRTPIALVHADHGTHGSHQHTYGVLQQYHSSTL